MRRPPMLLLVCVLTLVTGVALLRASAYVPPPPLPTAPASTLGSANIDLVSRYYDAVNLVLQSGDSTVFDSLVAANVVEYPARLDGLTGRAGLVETMLALRDTAPGIRVMVDDLQTTGTDQVTARIHAVGGANGNFLGWTLPPELLDWPLIEAFRIERGQIVERWHGEVESLLLEPLFRAPIEAPNIEMPVVQVVRVTHAPGSEVRLRPTSQYRLEYLESGVLSLSPGASNDPPPFSPLVVAAGQVLADHDWLLAQSVGPEPASLLEVIILAGPGVGSGGGTVGESHKVVVAGGRMTLAPGATLALPKLSSTALVTVEAGNLDITAGSARIWALRSGATRSTSSNQVWSMVISPVALVGDQRSEAKSHQLVAIGRSALIAPGATVFWHNPGETLTAAMVLTLVPNDDPVCLGSPACQTLLR